MLRPYDVFDTVKSNRVTWIPASAGMTTVEHWLYRWPQKLFTGRVYLLTAPESRRDFLMTVVFTERFFIVQAQRIEHRGVLD